MAGRPRKPQRLRELQGTLPAHLKIDTIPVCPVPPPPENLNGVERETWADLARQVEAIGTYDEANHEAFVLMVRVCAAVRQLDLTQMTSPVGTLLRQEIALLGRFGLTAADRTRVPSLPKISGNLADEEFAQNSSVIPIRRPPRPRPAPKPTPPASTLEPEWLTNWKRERDAKKAAAVGSSPGPKAGQPPPEGLASGPLTLPTE
jgi:hypothetical protein